MKQTRRLFACLATALLAVLTHAEPRAVKLWPHLPQVWAVPLVLQPEPDFFTALTDWWRQQRSPSGGPAAAP